MRILTFDGGGVLGVGPSHYLENWERLSGQAAHNLADLYAGTSTGAILAAGLALGLSASKITELYIKQASTIFKPRSIWRRGVMGPKYELDNLKKVLDQTFGDILIGQLRKKLVIPASDFQGEGEDGITDFYTNTAYPEMPIAEAVLRSCSAPTYFRAVGGRYADGGLFANNPTMSAIVYAQSLGIRAEEMAVLSLGTGGKYWKPIKLGGWNPVPLLKALLSFMLSAGPGRVIHRYVKSQPLAFYKRIIPLEPSPPLDSLKSMNEWMGVWDSLWLQEGPQVIAQFLEGSQNLPKV
jgi:patatin-like phospholipase/acyl hydrolase